MLHPSQRVLVQKFPAPCGFVSGRIALTLEVVQSLAHCAALEIFGFWPLKSREVVLSHVSQVAIEIHGLVIPDQRMQLASGLAGLRLQIHQQVQHLGGMIPAIDEIAGQNQVRVAADPGVLGVHQGGATQ